LSAAAPLSTLLRGAGVEPLSTVGTDPMIAGVSLDSRRVRPGDLFFAIRGLEADGEAFVPEALRRGARAVVAASARPPALDSAVAWVQVGEPRRAAALLAREAHGRPDEALTLIGITGTNGKTTVTYLVEAIAAAAGRRAGRIGTTGHATVGLERSAERTTPEAPDLFGLLAAMRDRRTEIVAMEVSSHALALHRVDGARFSVGAFLNLSRDHLDFHGSVEDYFAAKARLLDVLDADRHAVLPIDSEHGAELMRRTRARCLTFGRSPQATVRLTNEHCGLEGSTAVLQTPSGPLPVRTHLLADFNLLNVAAAAACAFAVELPPDSITSGVVSLAGVPGRMEPVDRGQPFKVLVDYAHTDAALDNLLRSLRDLTFGEVRLVFGCGGDRDRGKRGPMGRVAARGADRIFITSDNPRREDPDAIAEEIAAGVDAVTDGPRRRTTILDRREAIRAALDSAQPGDLVIIAGKGHETTLTAGDRVESFDDRQVAAEILESLGFEGGRHAQA
jgi:UDP-N-acetylmuramoyl-L-alanyl-D-glutamate--2,6-diaminopimelate ligase